MQVENDYREGVREGLSEGVTLQPRRGESDQPRREPRGSLEGQDLAWRAQGTEGGQRSWQGAARYEIRFSPAGAGSVGPWKPWALY